MSIYGIYNFSEQSDLTALAAAMGKIRGTCRVEIAKFVRGRTNRQLAYYFPVFCANLVEYMYGQGETWTLEQAHELFKGMFLRKTIVHPKTGELLGETVGSTGDLSTVEFNHYLDQCAVWLNQMFGIVVPDPMIYRESEYTSPTRRVEPTKDTLERAA